MAAVKPAGGRLAEMVETFPAPLSIKAVVVGMHLSS